MSNIQPKSVHTIKALLSLLLVLLFIPKTWADVNITTTIRPLQLIAEAIVQDKGSVTAIVSASQSPHHYSMSPSDRIALAQADLLIWIGPEFETYLADFFTQRSSSEHVLTLLQADNIILHNIVDGQVDAHLWLDSRNAILIAELITQQASKLDKQNEALFKENLNQFKTQINELNRETEATLSVSPRKSYAVYHNAYQYFEKQFGLNHRFAMLVDPEVQPGIQEIISVRRRFQEQSPECLFIEPDSNLDLVNTTLAGHQLSTTTIDLLGVRITSRQGAYIELMENMARDFASCLY
ncbi:MAG: hypothetical protein COA96_09900 [SAR86 cluster bacterium]|uniref:High-affinity zinc uptake system protein ZnuA n=1 Tax=SAR86 cluster bacterium TaxID=2030880 RepID=A0A2A5AYT8_9GAMM|nr:MAG: hypothetical protein COA96_09900 [SAR86 cluster bacterium]